MGNDKGVLGSKVGNWLEFKGFEGIWVEIGFLSRYGDKAAMYYWVVPGGNSSFCHPLHP